MYVEWEKLIYLNFRTLATGIVGFDDDKLHKELREQVCSLNNTETFESANNTTPFLTHSSLDCKKRFCWQSGQTHQGAFITISGANPKIVFTIPF